MAPIFVEELYQLLQEAAKADQEDLRRLIHWRTDEQGESHFLVNIRYKELFEQPHPDLPRHFTTTNQASFTTQLSKYGFRRVGTVGEFHEYSRADGSFHRGADPETLNKVKRVDAAAVKNLRETQLSLRSVVAKLDKVLSALGAAQIPPIDELEDSELLSEIHLRVDTLDALSVSLNDFQGREKGFQEREKGFQQREKDFQEREKDFQEREKDFQEREKQLKEKDDDQAHTAA